MSKMISIDKLKECEHNREYGGTTELATVKTLGILQPLLVEALEDGTYRVLDGHRRLLSARECGLKKVPCEIVDKEIAEKVMLLSNLDRKNLSPLDQYVAMSDLKKLGYKTNEIGDIVGVSKYQAERILRLGNLIPEYREMLQSGAISMSQASEVCLADERIQKKLLAFVITSWPAREIREKINYLRDGFSLSSFSDDFIKENDEAHCGNCLTCKDNPNADYLLFEECTKKEAVCCKQSCAWTKLQWLKKAKGCDLLVKSYYDNIWEGYLKEQGTEVDELKYPYSSVPNEKYENQLKALTLRGEVVYMGGNEKLSDEEENKSEKIKALQEKIDADVSNIQECIDKAIDALRTSNRKEPLEIMGSKVKLEVLSLAHRVGYMCVWDDACGKNLTEAITKAGLIDAVQGRAKAKQSDLDSPAVDEILLAIRFDVRMRHLLTAVDANYISGLYPPSWGDRLANIDKLHNLIKEASERFTIWPAEKDKLEDAEKRCNRFYEAFDNDLKKKEALEE